MKNKYNINIEENSVRIYINNILHLKLKQDELIGIQSWMFGYGKSRKYHIELTTKTQTIELVYNLEDKWKSILDLLDKNNLW